MDVEITVIFKSVMMLMEKVKSIYWNLLGNKIII